MLDKRQAYLSLISLFSSVVKEVSHKINGRRSLSIDQLSSLKSVAFSVLKRASKKVVACKVKGDNLLWSNKNCCFFVMLPSYRFSPKKASPLLKNRLIGD